MNTPAIRRLRKLLAADQPTYGLWITLESPSITEMAVACGLDWVVIDAEHGHLDFSQIVGHLRATVRSGTVALVRLAELNAGLIKRALDVGADGVVIPWIETESQIEQAVSFAHYPPEGRRGIGAERATVWGHALAAHVAEANEHVLVAPIIESVTARDNVGQLCRVPDVDFFFIGPADYSSTAGYRGQWEGPGVAEELIEIKDCLRRHGKQCGILATSHENLRVRREQGFRLLGIGADGGLLMGSMLAALRSAGREPRINPSLLVE
jgi:2-keto-3-deoxy-L-rhamnonate aldolase RhmA